MPQLSAIHPKFIICPACNIVLKLDESERAERYIDCVSCGAKIELASADTPKEVSEQGHCPKCSVFLKLDSTEREFNTSIRCPKCNNEFKCQEIITSLPQLEGREISGQANVSKLSPVRVSVNLEKGEEAYESIYGKRFGLVTREEVITKKKGVLSRALVGGVLLGPLGALGGAVTAGSRSRQRSTTESGEIDRGQIIMTNKRFMFIGDTVVSLQYNQILKLTVWPGIINSTLYVHYPDMVDGEYYITSASGASRIERVYKRFRLSSH